MCLRVQGLKGRVRQVAINYPSVACVPECKNEVTRRSIKFCERGDKSEGFRSGPTSGSQRDKLSTMS